MDATWPTDAARVPAGLTPARAWRWCVLRTLRDARLAAARGRPMSQRNAERLFRRRWQRAAVRFPRLTAVGQRRVAWGRQMVRRAWRVKFKNLGRMNHER